MSELKVEVVCHDNHLIITALQANEDENFFPAGGSKIGCVLIDTEKYLGMSDEAYELLRTMKKSGDDIGDVSAFESVNGQCFSWLGGLKRLVNMDTAETSREGIAEIKYVSIPNKVPVEVFEILTRQGAEK